MESKKKKGHEEPREVLQDGNNDADLLENGVEDTGRGKGKLGQSERVVLYIWIYIYTTKCKIDS